LRCKAPWFDFRAHFNVSLSGLLIRLESADRSTLLLLGVYESDESAYGVVLPADAGEMTELTIGFESFGLLADSEAENSQIAPDVSYAIVSIINGGSNEQSVSEHYSGTHRDTRRAAFISLEAKTLVVNPDDRCLDPARPVAGFRTRIGDRSLYLHPLLMITTFLSWADKWKR
jgi:hypothetical protein